MRACESVSRDSDPKALSDGFSAATLLGGGNLAGGSAIRAVMSSCLLVSPSAPCHQDFSGCVPRPVLAV